MEGTPDAGGAGRDRLGGAPRGRARALYRVRQGELSARAAALDGLKIVVDCANGAAYRTAPQVLWELGAEVIRIGTNPDGENINLGCGSTDPALCQKTVIDEGADLGIALDGDADRVHIIDETGPHRRRRPDHGADRDALGRRPASSPATRSSPRSCPISASSGCWPSMELRSAARGSATAMSSKRCGPADFNLGGEQSGHIILADHVTTGDGLLAALQVLAALVEGQKPASELCRLFEPVPQLLKNVRFNPAARPLEDATVRAAIASGEARLNGQGRLVIRASGTEPLIRVMGEAGDPVLLEAVVDEICGAVGAAAG